MSRKVFALLTAGAIVVSWGCQLQPMTRVETRVVRPKVDYGSLINKRFEELKHRVRTTPELQDIVFHVASKVEVSTPGIDPRNYADSIRDDVQAKLREAGFQVAKSRATPRDAIINLSIEHHPNARAPEVTMTVGSEVEQRGAISTSLAQFPVQAAEELIFAMSVRVDLDRLAAQSIRRQFPLAAALAERIGDEPSGVPRPHTTVVAVFDVEDASGRFDAKTTDQLTHYLSVRLAEVMAFRIVPRNDLRAQLQEEKSEAFAPCFDEKCQIELGKAVSAQKSFATQLLQIGKTCVITSTIYDLRSETTDRSVSAKTDCSDDSLVGAIDQIVGQLTASL
jgi:hypothetical protein